MDEDSIDEQIANYVIENKESHYRLVYTYVRNIEDALDIIQESIYKAFLFKGSLKNIDYIKTWYYRILVNTSLDFLRKRKRLVVVDDETLSGFDLGKMDMYEDIDLNTAIKELPEDYRIIIILRYFEDLKIREIAEILNLNLNTVKTRLYKGLEKLRIKINDEDQEE